MAKEESENGKEREEDRAATMLNIDVSKVGERRRERIPYLLPKRGLLFTEREEVGPQLITPKPLPIKDEVYLVDNHRQDFSDSGETETIEEPFPTVEACSERAS
mmetsp:Transcript_5974/g.8461  ORF Transcript_5974/g.8461 Transcript_5974/m.8461 type:complete len:104 (-) Transcript_5974:119-430(-)